MFFSFVQPRFGICFDVDGVLARGTLPLPQALNCFQKLVDDTGELNVPVTFVTNALNRNTDKANQIAGWMDVPARIHSNITCLFLFRTNSPLSAGYVPTKLNKSDSGLLSISQKCLYVFAIISVCKHNIHIRLKWILFTCSCYYLYLLLQVSPTQMVQAQGPLELFKGFHDKFCLIIGQGKIVDIAKEYPFSGMINYNDIQYSTPNEQNFT